MLPKNQESKKKKDGKGLFSFLKSKKKEKSALSTDSLSEGIVDASNSLNEIGETAIPRTKESFSSKELGRKIIDSKTIILIGNTGSGKSTLANVISGTSKFEESGASISGTREIQKEEFTNNDIKYAVIDTVGIGDTKLKKEEVLDKIAEAVYLAREGISQVLFVISGRFDEKEITNFNLLKSIIFDNSVVNHTTVIRTNFPDFEKIDDCEKDKKSLLTQNEKLSKIINSCKGTIHVDNPPLNLIPADNENEKKRQIREEKIEKRKVTRIKSREILLKHLKQVCQNQESPYKPSKLQNLSSEIFAYMEEKIRKREELAKKEKAAKEAEKKQISILEGGKSEAESISEGDSDSKNNENEDKEITVQQITLKQLEQDSKSNGKRKLLTKLSISVLEKEIKELGETKKLIEDIQQKDGLIRQVIFRHIFNNINDISQVTGADIFLNSLVKDNDDSASKLSFAELREKRKELEEKLSKGGNDQSLEKIRGEIEKKEKELLDLKKQLLNSEEVFEEWQKQGFTKEQVEEWVDTLKSTFEPEYDAPFCAWLRDEKKLMTERELSNEEVEQLRIEHNSQLIHFAQYFQQDFGKWTSGNEEIDQFIQKYQLEAANYEQVLEWIPFDRLSDIKEIGKGGFGSVYSATWLDGQIEERSTEKSEWKRHNNMTVALKTLASSQDSPADFLREIATHKSIRNLTSSGLECYGITQDTKTNEYLVVIQHADKGSLHKYLRKKFRELTWLAKLQLLEDISHELHNIHDYAGYIHADFHSGNILQDQHNNENVQSYIADLGLSRKKDDKNVLGGEIYGVMPYVAPEVLIGREFTQAADIYSFGVIMAEMSTGKRPFDGQDFNTKLAIKICKGERPEFAPGTPDCYVELAKQCMDSDPQKRPSASDVYWKISNWLKENEIKKQFLDADKVIKTLPIILPSHPDHMYTSKIISTRLITDAIKNLSQADSAQIKLDNITNNFESDYQSQVGVPPKGNN